MSDNRVNPDDYPKGFLRIRFGGLDTHYPAGLISGATVIKTFTDCGGEMGLRMDGYYPWFAAVEDIKFFLPLYMNEFVEVRGEVVAVGNRSRRYAFEMRRVVRSLDPLHDADKFELCDPPELIASGVIVGVKPKQEG